MLLRLPPNWHEKINEEFPIKQTQETLSIATVYIDHVREGMKAVQIVFL